MTATPPSAALAEFAADLSYDDLPERARRLAERCFVDTVGVTLAGAADDAGAATAGIAAPGETTLLGRDRSAALADAVLANGTAGHALDYDDVSWGMDGHPSVTLVAPALAVGEQVDATGRELLTAFVAGFETECYLAAPISPAHYERGWHATATFGTFGAAVATASLLGATAAETRQALNVAASFPAGLKRNFGSMTKPLHAGGATRAGVTAARLAVEGFTADARAISGDRGFWALYGDCPAGDPPALPPERWALLEEGVHVKKYPCCYFTHTAIASAADVAGDAGLAPAEVERVEVRASRGAVDALAHDEPMTPAEAKFSMPHTVAAALRDRGVGLGTFTADAVRDPELAALRERVSLEADPDLDYDGHESRLRVETADGVHERHRENPPGTHDDPLSREELREKFVACASRTLPDERVAATFERLDALRDLESSRALLAEL